jgi:hypothetical protein
MNLDRLWKAYRKRGLPAIIALFDLKNRSIELLDPEEVNYITENVVEIYGRGLYFDFGDVISLEGYPVKILVSGYPEVNLLEFLRPAQLQEIQQRLSARAHELEEHLRQLEALMQAGIVKEKDLKPLQQEYEQIRQLLYYFEQAIKGSSLALEQLKARIEEVKTLGPKFYLHSLYSRLSRYVNFDELWAQVGSLGNKVFLAIIISAIIMLGAVFLLWTQFMSPMLKANTQALQQLAQIVKQLQATNQSLAKNATVITVGLSLLRKGKKR